MNVKRPPSHQARPGAGIFAPEAPVTATSACDARRFMLVKRWIILAPDLREHLYALKGAKSKRPTASPLAASPVIICRNATSAIHHGFTVKLL
jgi:hypothetical protein